MIIIEFGDRRQDHLGPHAHPVTYINWVCLRFLSNEKVALNLMLRGCLEGTDRTVHSAAYLC